MRKLLSIVATLATTVGLMTLVGAPAEADWSMKSRFARERALYGDVDEDTYHIEHVYELQHRLRRAKVFDVDPNGVFNAKTRRAVKRFQRQKGLRVTGVATHRTWFRLIMRTTFGKRTVPDRCLNGGWHVCYDRRRHQLSLYRGGRLLNSWLVRGGSWEHKTRTGNFTVYWRDIDHKSSTYGGAPMPYSQFFSGGQAIHGSRAMMDPFVGHSHGCINMYVEDARQLWRMTHDKKLRVHVYGRWD